ncbi:uncharacterized protein LOC122028311 [Zingiber officinale]|uniref:Uncharacterized protein n=1 Tax=Zingiber officinale TaxID=94328 RepID=A0A8J5HZ85_ZINOF|nr:uncharacterized protein LOC122028311 [Zingiber officinale]KAG6536832.1 hypothetical protein ZIOFF_001903 [Zingiber officinale]
MASLVAKLMLRHSLQLSTKPPRKAAAAASSRPLEEALDVSLRSLRSTDDDGSPLTLAWLTRVFRLLAFSLSRAAALVSQHSLPASDELDSHLDAFLLILDACNAISAQVARLQNRLLHLRLAVRFLASEDGSRQRPPEMVKNARKAIKGWEKSKQDIKIQRHSVGEMLRRMRPADPPRGSASSVLSRASYSVESVSQLVMAAAMVALGLGEPEFLHEIRVPDEWPWVLSFNEVAAEVSSRVGASRPLGELEEVEAAVRRLKEAIDEEEDSERLGTATEAVDNATKAMTAALNGLADSVNSAFHAAMGTRNAALSRLRWNTRR